MAVTVVLDASALLALLLREPGADRGKLVLDGAALAVVGVEVEMIR